MFSGFINGKIIDSIIIGIITFIVTTIFKIPYAMLISVIVGVTNVIPFSVRGLERFRVRLLLLWLVRLNVYILL